MNADFATLAKAYGFRAERVSATKDIPAAFERALASRSGAGLDLEISRGANPEADIV